MLIMSVFDSDLTALEINRHTHSTSTNKFVALMPFFQRKLAARLSRRRQVLTIGIVLLA